MALIQPFCRLAGKTQTKHGVPKLNWNAVINCLILSLRLSSVDCVKYAEHRSDVYV